MDPSIGQDRPLKLTLQSVIRICFRPSAFNWRRWGLHSRTSAAQAHALRLGYGPKGRRAYAVHAGGPGCNPQPLPGHKKLPYNPSGPVLAKAGSHQSPPRSVFPTLTGNNSPRSQAMIPFHIAFLWGTFRKRGRGFSSRPSLKQDKAPSLSDRIILPPAAFLIVVTLALILESRKPDT